ncbi:MAG: hypothetical protein Harvfovirus2_49 [Harvfovirus sp.]|uniref:Uncharacterized protein n=1 Tax=Harvfovirus sp. TaxID=2487768 RepID=A0A3G5A4W9_9VIRU|nr:MAG: hypothetical protein Harvfovirus2_49 [Harvfovirus sp.]
MVIGYLIGVVAVGFILRYLIHEYYPVACVEIQESWFGLIERGKKINIAIRGDANDCKSWDQRRVYFYMTWVNAKGRTSRGVYVKILRVKRYKNLYEYISDELWEKVSPYLASYDETVKEHKEFFDESRPIDCVEFEVKN